MFSSAQQTKPDPSGKRWPTSALRPDYELQILWLAWEQVYIGLTLLYLDLAVAALDKPHLTRSFVDHSLAVAEKLWSCSYICRASWYSLWSLHFPGQISSPTLPPKPWQEEQEIPIDLLIQQERQNSMRRLGLRLGVLGSLLVHGLILWIALRLFQRVEPPTLAEEMIRFEMMELPPEPQPEPRDQLQPIAELPPPPPPEPQLPPPEPVISESEVSLATPPPQPTPIPTPPPTPVPTPPPPIPSPVPSPPPQPANPVPVQQVPQTRFTPLINAFQSSDPNSSPLPMASSAPEPVAPSIPVAEAVEPPSTPDPTPPLPTPKATPEDTRPDVMARPLPENLREPQYPERARRMNQEGSTLLKARVDQDGQVVQVQIVASSGHPVLDEAAQQAVQTWRFAPAQKNGEAIPSWVTVPINFSLQ